MTLAGDGSIVLAGWNDTHAMIARLWRDDAPAATISARTRTQPGSSAYRFTVTYRADSGVDVASLNNSDLYITARNFERVRAILVDAQTSSDGLVTATYKMKPPGGSWDTNDNRRYTLRLRSHQVADKAGHFAEARIIGTFLVRIRSDAASSAVPMALAPLHPDDWLLP
jgi:hypothetical protein